MDQTRLEDSAMPKRTPKRAIAQDVIPGQARKKKRKKKRSTKDTGILGTRG